MGGELRLDSERGRGSCFLAVGWAEERSFEEVRPHSLRLADRLTELHEADRIIR